MSHSDAHAPQTEPGALQEALPDSANTRKGKSAPGSSFGNDRTRIWKVLVQPPTVLVEVISDRELLAREKRRIESAIVAALRDVTQGGAVVFSDLIDRNLGEVVLPSDGEHDVDLWSPSDHPKNG